MDVRFVVVAPSKARKTYPVRLPLVVGRGEDAKFRIQQDSVSRQHCRFSVEGGVVCVTDLGSTNGTLVSGERIEAHAVTPVSSGTEVRIGATVLRVEYSAAAAAAASRDADTVPLSASAGLESLQPAAAAAGAEALPELEPLEPALTAEAEPAASAASAAEPPVAEPAAAGAEAEPADVPAFPEVDAAPVATDALVFPDADPAPAAAEGSFDFLGGEASPPTAGDDKLDDFFKSLS